MARRQFCGVMFNSGSEWDLLDKAMLYKHQDYRDNL